MRSALATLALLVAQLAPAALAQGDPHQHHQHHEHHAPAPAPAPAHAHDVGPAGATYDLRWIDAMVQHHTGALRMSEFVFNIDQPGVGSLANTIWREQAREIKAMAQWRRAWYPEAPGYSVVLRASGDPNTLGGLQRMDADQVGAMRMMGSQPSKASRVTWFLEGMVQHHGAALVMAHDALSKSSTPTIRRLAREIIVAQRGEIIELRRMLQRDGLKKPEYHQFDALFAL